MSKCWEKENLHEQIHQAGFSSVDSCERLDKHGVVRV